MRKFERHLDDYSLLYRLGWRDEDCVFCPTLEDYVARPEYADKNEQAKFTLNRCPELVHATIVYLAHKHRHLTSLAAVTRYLTNRGAIAISEMAELKMLKEVHGRLYLEGTEADRRKFSENNFKPSYQLSMTSKRMTIYTPKWIAALIEEIALYLGISKEVVVEMALIAGAVTSEKWIPDRHKNPMIEELLSFSRFVNEAAARARSSLI